MGISDEETPVKKQNFDSRTKSSSSLSGIHGLISALPVRSCALVQPCGLLLVFMDMVIMLLREARSRYDLVSDMTGLLESSQVRGRYTHEIRTASRVYCLLSARAKHSLENSGDTPDGTVSRYEIVRHDYQIQED